MSFAFNVPVNGVSFGQISTGLLREAYSRGLEPALFPIGNKLDLSSQRDDAAFLDWLKKCIAKGFDEYSREEPCIKLWHLNSQSVESFGDTRHLITFHELDEPTKHELNVVKNNDVVYFTSEFSKKTFEELGAKNLKYLPLFFDSYNFNTRNRTYYSDDRIAFNLCGKFEKRKHHAKIINAWVKKFGNNKKFYLNCAVFNTFLPPEKNEEMIKVALERKEYFNINFLGHMAKNEIYNDFLNSGDIIIGMSGGEGWGLPEFQSVALGCHSVMLNATGYQSWANKNNSVLVEPNGKIPAYDGIFFSEGKQNNQGNIFDWDVDDFISACEEAVKRVEASKVNEEGLKLQTEFTASKTLDVLLKGMNHGQQN